MQNFVGEVRGGGVLRAVADAMSAAEIIEMIEKLPLAERAQVRVYLEKKLAVADEVREIRYSSDEKFDEISPKIFE